MNLSPQPVSPSFWETPAAHLPLMLPSPVPSTPILAAVILSTIPISGQHGSFYPPPLAVPVDPARSSALPPSTTADPNFDQQATTVAAAAGGALDNAPPPQTSRPGAESAWLREDLVAVRVTQGGRCGPAPRKPVRAHGGEVQVHPSASARRFRMLSLPAVSHAVRGRVAGRIPRQPTPAIACKLFRSPKSRSSAHPDTH
jgi:hypothetical protein